MATSERDSHAQARAAVERVLESLGVRDYLYTLEHWNGRWVLSVECAFPGGWQSTAIDVDPKRLVASLHDLAQRERLCAEWEPHLKACLGPHARGADRPEAQVRRA
ncbi:MAG: hypothetical protein N2653_00765 [Burkholderiales bacterium]|nr:hypothetical protein [Burkholderiales bacterium]